MELNFEVELYETKEGRCPAEEFLDSLETKMWAKTTGLIKILQEKGIELREPYTKYLEDGIFELRVKQGSNISRLHFFFCENGTIVITNGYIKKDNKPPRYEVELSRQYREDYINRHRRSTPNEI